MKAILLAAGLGQRLRPLTNDIPKCLVPICGKPLLQYWFELLLDNDVAPLLVNTHYFSNVVEEFIKGYVDKSKIQMIYEKDLLGTGGTVVNNADFCGNDAVMLIHADNLSHFNVRAFMDAHHNRPSECAMTMMTFTSPTPETCGIVEIDDPGVVTGFYEKIENPPSELANGAVYIIEPEVVSYLKGLNRTVIDFSTEVIPAFMNRIATFHNDIYHRDIGNMESYDLAQNEFKSIVEKYKLACR